MEISPVSAREQMQFQEYMSNTAHQREVADLKAAGLNPVLSAHSNGASTPSGASDSLSEILGLANSALGVARGGLSGMKAAMQNFTEAVESVAETVTPSGFHYEPVAQRFFNIPENGTTSLFGGKLKLPNWLLNQVQDSIVDRVNRHSASSQFWQAVGSGRAEAPSVFGADQNLYQYSSGKAQADQYLVDVLAGRLKPGERSKPGRGGNAQREYHIPSGPQH